MRARFYNPEVRRFLNRDVVLGSVARGQSLNRFGFVEGRPINFIDPWGLTYADVFSVLNFLIFHTDITSPSVYSKLDAYVKNTLSNVIAYKPLNLSLTDSFFIKPNELTGLNMPLDLGMRLERYTVVGGVNPNTGDVIVNSLHYFKEIPLKGDLGCYNCIRTLMVGLIHEALHRTQYFSPPTWEGSYEDENGRDKMHYIFNYLAEYLADIYYPQYVKYITANNSYCQ
jgi:hypothetical protein